MTISANKPVYDLSVETIYLDSLFALNAVIDYFLLLCSDGLSNIVTDQELLYEAIHGGEPSDCCQRLLHITLSRGAPDNVTIVLLQM